MWLGRHGALEFESELVEGLLSREVSFMLVLNRKSDQEIILGGNIRVKVLSVKGNTVRLGIDAPGEVSILRGELVMVTNDHSTKPPLEPITSDIATPSCDVSCCG